MVVIGILGYAMGFAYTLGLVRRRYGEHWAEWLPLGVVPVAWPLAWIGWLAWRLCIRPTIPVLSGLYRVGAGMTWDEPDEEVNVVQIEAVLGDLVESLGITPEMADEIEAGAARLDRMADEYWSYNRDAAYMARDVALALRVLLVGMSGEEA